MLRSVSAFETYRKVYRDVITPSRVAELLILRGDMPRSLASCLNEVSINLEMVRNRRSEETERRAGLLRAELRYGRIEDILDARPALVLDRIPRAHQRSRRACQRRFSGAVGGPLIHWDAYDLLRSNAIECGSGLPGRLSYQRGR